MSEEVLEAAKIKWEKFTDKTRVYILDTGVLLHSDPDPIEYFRDSWVVIGIRSLRELERLQSSASRKKAREATSALRLLSTYRAKGNLRDGLPIYQDCLQKKGANPVDRGMIIVDDDDEVWGGLPESIKQDKEANALIAIARGWEKKIHDQKHDSHVIIVSNNMALGIKAAACRIAVETYGHSDIVDIKYLPTGMVQINLRDEEQAVSHTFHEEGGFLHIEQVSKSLAGKELLSNQFVHLIAGEKDLGCGIYKDDSKKIFHIKFNPLEGRPDKGKPIVPLNIEQACAMHILDDDDTTVKLIVGNAGAGKSLLAMNAGLSKVWSNRQERLIVFISLAQASDRDVGFLPGTLEEKIAPFRDHIENAFMRVYASKHGIGGKWKEAAETELKKMKENHTFEIRILNFERGDSIDNAFIMVEDSQNLDVSDTRLVLTRVGEGSEIVFEGDLRQIDNSEIDFGSSGFTRLVERFQGLKINDRDSIGLITLVTTERSPLAALSVKVY